MKTQETSTYPRSAGRARPFSLAELLASRPVEPLSWIMEGVLPEDALAGLIGRYKLGKSLLAEHLALCIASGTDWLGMACAEPGPVLYLDFEMGWPMFSNRVVLMQRALPEFDAQTTLKNFDYAERPRLVLDPQKAAANDEDWERLEDKIAEISPRLLVVDSFRRLFKGSENDSREMAWAMGKLAGLRDAASERPLTVLVLHHVVKDAAGVDWEDAARGSGDFNASTDAMLGLGGSHRGTRTLRAHPKAGPEIEPLRLQFDPATNLFEPAGRSEESITAESEEPALDEEILAAIRKNPGRSGTDLRKLTKAERQPFFDSVHRLERAGRISNNGTKSRPRWHATHPPDPS